MGRAYGKFKFNIGDKISTFRRNLIIVDREYRDKTYYKNNSIYIHHQKYYKYKCLSCGNIDWIVEYALEDNMHCGCNVCCESAKKIKIGVNDLGTTAPWMVKYLKDKSDAFKYTKYSKSYIEFTCPDYGRVYTKQIHNVYANKKLSCICQDGVSYPNKFVYDFLSQTGVNFYTEKKFEWSQRKLYDFYIEDNGNKIIIENQGRQHYDRAIYLKRSLEEEHINDKLKKNLAEQNGIDYYQINCSKSDPDFIRNNIVSSGLLDVLNINENSIDWHRCAIFATFNMTKMICDYYSKHNNLKPKDLAEIFPRSKKTIIEYLEKGTKLGWCNYDPKKKYPRKATVPKKPVICLESSKAFDSTKDAAIEMELPDAKNCGRAIRKSIERGQHYHGYTFRYV